MTQKNNIQDLQLALIKGENINVSGSSVIKELFILLAGILAVILIIFLFSDFIADIYISKMSDNTQIKIEKLLSSNFDTNENNNNKNSKKIAQLNKLKQKIINQDTTLKGKSNFPIYIRNSENINACIIPNGTIFINSGLLSKNFTEEELSFVLAHEIGHYAHRDHLRVIGKQILAGLILTTISGQNNSLTKFFSGISDIENMAYSRKQEKAADKYASNMLIKLYGTNSGGKTFILKIQKQEKLPAYFQYISTHPAWTERLKLLENEL